MNHCLQLSAICLLALLTLGASKPNQPYTVITDASYDAPLGPNYLMAKCRLVILGTSKNFDALQKEALAIAKKSRIAFSMQGCKYDGKDSLVPIDGDDDNRYVQRRNNFDPDNGEPFISIEESRAYNGLKPGYFIIVGSVCFTPAATKKFLATFRRSVPKAYTQKTSVYMGCRH